MTNSVIKDKLTTIFQTVFSDSHICLSNELTAGDVDGWDSLTHILMITEVENCFFIKFKLKDINRLENVGELIELIQLKLYQ